MKPVISHIFLFLAVLLFALSCNKPTEFTEYTNPYDEQSDAFIPHPDLVTLEIDNIRAFEAWSGGEFTNDYGNPVIAKGVCWSSEENPTTDDNCTNDGQGLEAFESHLNDLEPSQIYFVRAYAINADTTIYGGLREFATLDGRPVLTTAPVTEIATTTARSGGEITDDGYATVSARGVCWSTSQNPATGDSCTNDGSGTGSFTSSLTNLSPDTRYYVRAYASNSVGTAYGNQLEFRTSEVSWPRDTQTTVVEVTNPATGRTWMDRNLGASRAATSMDDEQSYGDLYQWGREADGHQRRNSATTTTLSNTDQPGHGSFILAPNSPFDWRSPQNNNLWQGVNGINNPCPVGYRLPTEAEWVAERQSWSNDNAAGAFNSLLRLPVAGLRSSSGSLVGVGSSGSYWSGSVSHGYYWTGPADETTSRFLYFGLGLMYSDYRSLGFSVRCIKN